MIDVFSHYVESGFAAYPEKRVPYEAFDRFVKMCEGYPAVVVKEETGKVVGFGMLRFYNPFPHLLTGRRGNLLHPS